MRFVARVYDPLLSATPVARPSVPTPGTLGDPNRECISAFSRNSSDLRRLEVDGTDAELRGDGTGAARRGEVSDIAPKWRPSRGRDI